MKSYRDLLHSRRLISVGLALLLVAISVGITAKVALGIDDPDWLPDSYFVSTQPTISQQEFQASLSSKDATDQQMVQESQGNYNGPTIDKSAPIPTVATNPWPTGIFQPVVAPYPSTAYVFVNQWQGQIGGNYVQAYAGALGTYQAVAPPGNQQGVLVIRTTAVSDQATSTSTDYVTTSATGALHVTSVSGTCLSVLSSTNAAYQFDLVNRTWSCGPSNNQAP